MACSHKLRSSVMAVPPIGRGVLPWRAVASNLAEFFRRRRVPRGANSPGHSPQSYRWERAALANQIAGRLHRQFQWGGALTQE